MRGVQVCVVQVVNVGVDDGGVVEVVVVVF